MEVTNITAVKKDKIRRKKKKSKGLEEKLKNKVKVEKVGQK